MKKERFEEAPTKEKTVLPNGERPREDVGEALPASEANTEPVKSEERETKNAFSRFTAKIFRGIGKALATLGGWLRRMFRGASRELADKTEKSEKRSDKKGGHESVEEIVSPGKQIVKGFLSKKLAVIALIILVGMFLTMFIGPLFNPLDLSYNEVSQANMKPGMYLMKVPSGLKNDIKEISSSSKFSVGLSGSGKVYVWGAGEITSVINMKDIPEEVTEKEIVHVAAGTDHAIAIAKDGTVYGWGQNAHGQYGKAPEGNSSVEFLYTFAPSAILEGLGDGTKVHQLTCGTQVTAVVMEDGSVYMWGNHNSGATNMSRIKRLTNVEKIVFTSTAAVALLKDGTVSTDGTSAFNYITLSDGNGGTKQVVLSDYLAENGYKIVDIAAAATSVALLTEEGKVIVAGSASYGESDVPAVAEGEKIVSLSGGLKHYSAVTDKGHVYSWGSNSWKQTSVPSGLEGVEKVFTGPFQNYAVDANGKLEDCWGLKGYLMGTDAYGRDIWNRILNGGRLTMTIGAIAVIISSVVGVIVGCLAGYFGGWVDMLLMRVTEIFSAIPFLPFALILSAIVQLTGLSEMTRIFLIMVVLGLLSWTGLARLVRGQVLAEREKEFVLASKAMGVKESKIAFRHILPNVISVIIVSMTLDFAGCMLTESQLSYLGFGVQLPRPTWGNMLNGANNSVIIQSYWWQWVFPALFLAVATICINIIGDALRDVMDPKSSLER